MSHNNHPYPNYKPNYTNGYFDQAAAAAAAASPVPVPPTPAAAEQLPFDMRKLCRVCGMEGMHSLHQPIPFYVHERQSEVGRWPKSIAVMMADACGEAYTNIAGPVEDALPQRICTICITYLKHAIEFRQQTLDNLCRQRLRMNKAAREANSGNIGNSGGCSSNSNGSFRPATPSFFYKPNGIPAANESAAAAAATEAQSTEALRQEIDQFFAEELSAGTGTNTGTSSSSETDDNDEDDASGGGTTPKVVRALARARDLRQAIHGFFNYSETPFADDAADAEIDGARIRVAAPADDHKERKCAACKRQFVLSTSYDAHVAQCVQTKLFEFVGACQRLVEMRRERIVSEQEFIRRMVFAVKGMAKALARCYRGVAAPRSADAVPKAVTKRMFEVPLVVRQSGPGREGMDGAMPPVPPKAWNNGVARQPRTAVSSTPPVVVATVQRNDLFGSDSAPENGAVGSPVPVSGPVPTMATPFPKMANFAATCSACQMRFSSIDALEMHNLLAHNPYVMARLPVPATAAVPAAAAVPSEATDEDPLLARLRGLWK